MSHPPHPGIHNTYGLIMKRELIHFVSQRFVYTSNAPGNVRIINSMVGYIVDSLLDEVSPKFDHLVLLVFKKAILTGSKVDCRPL